MSVGMARKKDLCVRKKRLLSEFESQGIPYRAAKIDREAVLYRKLRNYDIEISGASHRRPFSVYVWALQNERHPVYTVENHDIQSKDIPAAAAVINALAEKYEEAPAHEF